MGTTKKILFGTGLGAIGAGTFLGGKWLGNKLYKKDMDEDVRKKINEAPEEWHKIRLKSYNLLHKGGVNLKNAMYDYARGDMTKSDLNKVMREYAPAFFGSPEKRDTWFLDQYKGSEGKNLYQDPDDYWAFWHKNKLDKDQRKLFQDYGNQVILAGQRLHQMKTLGYNKEKIDALHKDFDSKNNALLSIQKGIVKADASQPPVGVPPQSPAGGQPGPLIQSVPGAPQPVAVSTGPVQTSIPPAVSPLSTPPSFYDFLSDEFNREAEAKFGAGKYLPMEAKMFTEKTMNPWNIQDWNMYTQAEDGGEIPRYDIGGEQEEEDAQPFDWAGALRRRESYERSEVPSYGFGGYAAAAQQQMAQQQMAQQQMAQQQAQGAYGEALQRGLMQEGMENPGHQDYRSRMMMETYRDRPQASNFSQNGINDPTGELDWNWDPQQQAKQQQLDQAVRSNIPYYQQAFAKMSQKSRNPKGAMRNVMPPRMRG